MSIFTSEDISKYVILLLHDRFYHETFMRQSSARGVASLQDNGLLF